MSITASIWLVIVAGFVAANIPFINQRLLAVGPKSGTSKPLWIRLLELVVLYVVVGLVATTLEGKAGQRSAQGWEFYAITATLFLTFAFPGFVYQYLTRKTVRAS